MVIKYFVNLWRRGGLSPLIDALLESETPFASKLLELVNEIKDVLKTDPDQLIPQILARIGSDDEEFNEFLEAALSQRNAPWLKPAGTFPRQENALVKTLIQHDDFVGGLVAVSPERFVSSSEDGEICVWNAKTLSVHACLDGHSGPVNHVDVSPDGKFLISASDDTTIKAWDTRTWKLLKTFKGHTDYVSKAAITRSGLVVSVSKDQTVRVWDFKSGKCIHVLEGHNSWVYMLALSPAGDRAITASVNNTMIVWDLKEGNKVETIFDGGGDVTYIMGLILDRKNRTGKGHDEYPTTARWLENGPILTAASEIIAWDEATFKEISRFSGHNWKVKGLSIIKKRKYMLSVAHTIKTWDFESGRELNSIIGHDGEEIYSCAVTPDEKYLLSGDKMGLIKVWDIDVLLKGNKKSGHASSAYSVFVTENRSIAITGGFDKSAIVWDADTCTPLHVLANHSALDVNIMGTRNEGREVITSASGQVRIWNIPDGTLLKEITLENSLYGISAAVIFQGGTKAFCGTISYSPMLLDLNTGEQKRYTVDYSFVDPFTLSSDGKHVLACTYPGKLLDANGEKNDDEGEKKTSPVVVWDLEDECIKHELFHPVIKEKKEPIKDDLYPSYALFNQDENKVIAGFSEGTICIWERETGMLLQHWRSSSNYITALYLTRDGRLVSTESGNSVVKFWDVESGALESEITRDARSINHIKVMKNGLLGAAVYDDTTICALDLEKHCILASITIPCVARDMELSEKGIYVAGDDGFLYKFTLICPSN
ncbi:MAG: WD40 repeat domain-containing protein [Candidatus Hodarchaeota archaeon]